MKNIIKLLIFGVIISTIISFLLNLSDLNAFKTPSMLFNFVYETTQPASVIKGQLIECDDKNCLSESPLDKLRSQSSHCGNGQCGFSSGYKPYNKLIVTFSDKTRESNIFKTYFFHAILDAKVTDSNLIVKDASIPFLLRNYRLKSFLIGLIITLITESVAALIFLVSTKIPKKILFIVLVVNLVSSPIIWVLFPLLELLLSFNELVITTWLEVFTIVFEGYFIYLFNKQIISLRKSLNLSVLINIASIIVYLLFSVGYF